MPKKQSVIKRIGRGLKILYGKVSNSNYVKNMQEEQTKADPNEFATDLSGFASSEI